MVMRPFSSASNAGQSPTGSRSSAIATPVISSSSEGVPSPSQSPAHAATSVGVAVGVVSKVRLAVVDGVLVHHVLGIARADHVIQDLAAAVIEPLRRKRKTKR